MVDINRKLDGSARLSFKVKLLLKSTRPNDPALDELFIKNQLKGNILIENSMKDKQLPRSSADVLKDNRELTKMLGQKIEDIKKLVST